MMECTKRVAMGITVRGWFWNIVMVEWAGHVDKLVLRMWDTRDNETQRTFKSLM